MVSARSFSRDNYRANGRHVNQKIQMPKARGSQWAPCVVSSW